MLKICANVSSPWWNTVRRPVNLWYLKGLQSRSDSRLLVRSIDISIAATNTSLLNLL